MLVITANDFASGAVVYVGEAGWVDAIRDAKVFAGSAEAAASLEAAEATPDVVIGAYTIEVSVSDANGNAGGNANGNASGNANGDAGGNANGNASGNANGDAGGNANGNAGGKTDITPLQFREKIRAIGPSNYHHGKQEEGTPQDGYPQDEGLEDGRLEDGLPKGGITESKNPEGKNPEGKNPEGGHHV